MNLKLARQSHKYWSKLKSKVLTVLKSTKLQHEHTTYSLIYVHVCILHTSWCKKASYCEGNFDVCLVVIGIRDIWKMEPNLQIGCHKLKIQYRFCGYCFVKTTFF